MITVNGRWAGGKEWVGERGWASVQSMVEVGKNFCPNFLQPFLENIDRSCNDGSRDLIPVFHNPHRKCRPSPSAVALTLECLEGCPLRPRGAGGRKNKFGSISKRPLNILKAVMRSSRSRRAARNEGPVAAVALRMEGDARQLPTV